MRLENKVALATDAGQTPGETMVKVWDRFVRVSHWAVALGFVVAYLTEDDLVTLHVWAGYLVGVFVVLRLFWGFVGSKHARFSDFVSGPRRTRVYLRELIAFRAPRYLGHSPAGGAMAIALWLGLIAVVWSGIEFHVFADGQGGDAWKEFHEIMANLLLVLVVLHLGGVLLAGLVHRENLVRAMWDGRKRAD